jgi:hypothetical protein
VTSIKMHNVILNGTMTTENLCLASLSMESSAISPHSCSSIPLYSAVAVSEILYGHVQGSHKVSQEVPRDINS